MWFSKKKKEPKTIGDLISKQMEGSTPQLRPLNLNEPSSEAAEFIELWTEEEEKHVEPTLLPHFISYIIQGMESPTIGEIYGHLVSILFEGQEEVTCRILPIGNADPFDTTVSLRLLALLLYDYCDEVDIEDDSTHATRIQILSPIEKHIVQEIDGVQYEIKKLVVTEEEEDHEDEEHTISY